jgi:dihydroorotate dehydrogenase (fumarate)
MDTSTSYLGFQLLHPFIAGASPFGYQVDTVKRLEDAGCAAVVLHSLFEEQITLAAEGTIAHMDVHESEFAEPVAYFPSSQDYAFTPDAYAEHVSRVKQAVRIP